jgi:hypothetical protein
MNRRKFLIGAGSLAAGSAAAMGTGAFTSVDADRTVSVSVAGDASALLAIEPAEEGGSETPNASEYVNDNGNAVELDFTGSDIDDDGSDEASGINANAETKFANLLDITNQGTQAVQVGVDDDNGFIANVDGGVFAEGPDSNTDSSGNPNFPDPDGDGDQDSGAGFSFPDDPVSLEPGDTVENIGLDINDPSTIPSDGSATLVIQAYSDEAYEQETGNTPADN